MTGNALANSSKPAATRGSRKAAKKETKRKGKKASTLPSRTKTPLGQGIYIPSSRVKRHLDGAGLNKPIEDAIKELRNAEPHDKVDETFVKNEQGKKVKVVTNTVRTELVSFNQLSERTRNMIAEAKTANDEREKAIERAEKSLADRVKLMTAEERARYDEKEKEKLKEEAKLAEERAAKAAQLAEDIKSGKVDAKKYPVRGVKKVTKYSNEIELLSKMRVRFSKDASLQLAATICTMVHERTKFAITNCIANNLSIVKVRHAIDKGHDLLDFASLIRNLPAYRKAIATEETRVANELKAQEEKKAKKAAGAAADAEVKEAVKEDANDDTDVEDDDEEKASFEHYVRQVAHNVINIELQTFNPKDKKEKHPFEAIRISAEYREWMNDIIIEFIRRFCPLLNGQIKTSGIKTVSRDTVRLVVNFYIESNGLNAAECNKLFDDKFQMYQTYTQKRKEEKDAKKAEAPADGATAEEETEADE